MKFVPFLNVRWKRFSITSTTFLKTLMLLTTEEESNGELAFLDTLLKRNDGKISQLIYRKYLHYSSHHQTSCKVSVVFSLFNRVYSIITNKDDFTKENAIKGIKKEFLVKLLRELLLMRACLNRNSKRKPQISWRRRSE